MKAAGMAFALCLASCDAQEQGAGAEEAQQDVPHREQLRELRTRLELLEAQLAEQRRLMLGALDMTVEKLDGSCRRCTEAASSR